MEKLGIALTLVPEPLETELKSLLSFLSMDFITLIIEKKGRSDLSSVSRGSGTNVRAMPSFFMAGFN